MPKLISVGQLIDQTWEGYTKHFRTFMKISLWTFAISLLWIIGDIFAPVGDTASIVASGSLTGVELFGLITMIIASFPVAPIISIWILVSLIIMTEPLIAGKKIDIRATAKQGWKKFLPYIWVAFLKGIVLLIPVAFVIPGFALIFANMVVNGGALLGAISILVTFVGLVAAVVFSIMLTVELNFIGFELTLKNMKGIKALQASRSLVKGKFWATLFRIIIPKIIFYLGGFLAQMLLMMLLTVLLASLSSIGAEGVIKLSEMFVHVASMAVIAIVTPLVVLADYLLFDSLHKAK
ncbi:MAG: hypothetical protein Q8P30_03825 [Candidatus Uhrbacteria bacterium]|nr:hypothetical protein [Candidatus Uhrbacteria bacterium]